MGETRLALRRFARRRMALAGTLFLALLILGALAAPIVSPYDPLRQDLARMLTGPSPAHLLGTDDLGRDVLTRLLYGARLSLGAACLAVAIATVAGVAIGLVEVLMITYFSSAYTAVAVWGLLILILIFAPNGLFGSQIKAEKV